MQCETGSILDPESTRPYVEQTIVSMCAVFVLLLKGNSVDKLVFAYIHDSILEDRKMATEGAAAGGNSAAGRRPWDVSTCHSRPRSRNDRHYSGTIELNAS